MKPKTLYPKRQKTLYIINGRLILFIIFVILFIIAIIIAIGDTSYYNRILY